MKSVIAFFIMKFMILYAATAGVVKGVITEKGTGEPLAGATITTQDAKCVVSQQPCPMNNFVTKLATTRDIHSHRQCKNGC